MTILLFVVVGIDGHCWIECPKMIDFVKFILEEKWQICYSGTFTIMVLIWSMFFKLYYAWHKQISKDIKKLYFFLLLLRKIRDVPAFLKLHNVPWRLNNKQLFENSRNVKTAQRGNNVLPWPTNCINYPLCPWPFCCNFWS